MAKWFHVADGTECAAGYGEGTSLCAEGGGPVISADAAVHFLGLALAKLGHIRDWATSPGYTGQARELLAILDAPQP